MRPVMKCTPESRILHDVDAMEAAHLSRCVDQSIPAYLALSYLRACVEDYLRHGVTCLGDLDDAMRRAGKVLAKIEGGAA